MEPRRNNFRPKFQKKQEHNINNFISHQQVRVIGDGIESKICSLAEALELARSMELDLVETSSTATPPVCKIVDYGKFLYEKKKREKEIKNNNKTETKEIQLGPNTQQNDLDFKSKHALNFLNDGNKVKLSMKFQGRQIAYKEQGEILMLRFLQMIESAGKPEFLPKMEGKSMYVIVSPKKQSKN